MIETKNAYLSSKKTVVQFVLSLFVFFIHFSSFSVFCNDTGLNRVFNILLIPTGVAVPLFFVIAGALFYRDYTLSATLRKWKNRFFSLCVPYLIWNTFWLVLALLGNYTPLGAFLGGVKATLTWQNVLRGVFLYGYFEPFWFIHQTILLTALCPLIYMLMKNKWIGLTTIVAFYIFLCFDLKFDRTLFYSTSKILHYLIGAWIGIHCFDWLVMRKTKAQAAVGLVVFILCCVFQGVTHLLPQWCNIIQLPLVITVISCGAFWTAFDLFSFKTYPQFAKESFLIYAGHSLVGATVAKVISILLPDGHLFTIVTAILAFPTTIVILCVCGNLLTKYFPRLKRILTGR